MSKKSYKNFNSGFETPEYFTVSGLIFNVETFCAFDKIAHQYSVHPDLLNAVLNSTLNELVLKIKPVTKQLKAEGKPLLFSEISPILNEMFPHTEFCNEHGH